MDGDDVSINVYYGLVCIAAQRTGKLWYCSDGYQWPREKYISRKAMGLVNEVFDPGES